MGKSIETKMQIYEIMEAIERENKGIQLHGKGLYLEQDRADNYSILNVITLSISFPGNA